jgi:hypothetical protein
VNRRYQKRREAEDAGYRSGFEKEMAELLSKAKISFSYETGTIKYTSPVRGGLCLSCGTNKVGKGRSYLPDFRIGGIIIETKGKFSSADRTKFLAIKASNPTIDLRLVFQRDNKLRRNSETHYSDWAKAHGFTYHVGLKLPPKWLKELKRESKATKDPPSGH